MTGFSFVWILVFSVFLFYCSKAQIPIYVTSGPISLGTSDVSVSCTDFGYRRFFEYEDFEMILQFRQNKTNEWETIVKVNDVGSFITNISTAIETHLEIKETCGYRMLQCAIYASISIHMNTCEYNLYPSFRCQILNGTNSVDSSREVQLEITGNPTYIDSPLIIFPLTSKVFELGEVLQLQCTGEKDFSTNTNTDIRWCKSVAGQYEVITLQENPQTQIVSESKDGCTFVQKSEIFYHIIYDDNDLEIMCELGYNENSKICGKGRFNSTLRIPTYLKGDGWALSPVIMYTEESMLSSQNITMEGIGKTIQLLCVGSKTNQTESIIVDIMWCVRKKNNTDWKPIALQENKLETMINSSGKIIIYSKITYHLIVMDNAIDVMCQISSSPKCGSGVIHSNVSLQVYPSELEGQYYLKQREIIPETARREAWMVVAMIVSVTLLIVILFLVTLLLILSHRKGGLPLFGIVIKTESQPVVNGRNENYKNTELNRELSPKEIAGDIYQNQQCSSTATESGNAYEMPLNHNNQPTYEEINKKGSRKEEYEALSF